MSLRFRTCSHVSQCCSQHALCLFHKHIHTHSNNTSYFSELTAEAGSFSSSSLSIASFATLTSEAHRLHPTPSRRLRLLDAPQRRRQGGSQRHQRLQSRRAFRVFPRDHRRVAHVLLPLPSRTRRHPRGYDTPSGSRGSRSDERGRERRSRPRILPVRFHGFPYDLRYPRGSAPQRVGLAFPHTPAVARRAFHRRNAHGGEGSVPRNSRGKSDSRAGRVVRRIR